jgi:hypothetical protein
MMLFARLYVMIDNLLTCGKYLHDRITSLREDIQTHKTSFIEVPVPSQESERLCITSFIEVPVPSQESERLCICVLGVSIFFLRF